MTEMGRTAGGMCQWIERGILYAFVTFFEFIVLLELELKLSDFVADVDGRFGSFATIMSSSFNLVEFI